MVLKEELPVRGGFIMEMNIDTISMITALVIMFVAVAAKMLTGQLINKMKSQIALVDQERKQSLGRLKIAQAQKKVGGKNKATLEGKKKALKKQIKELKAELKGYQKEGKRRRMKSEELKGKLVQPA